MSLTLMRWSTLFIPTLREHPAEAEVISHQLLLRAGYIRQLSAGIYSYLLLAQRSLLKIQQIVREEMNAIGGQEVLLPALNPAEIWQESGRWTAMGDNMFRLKDRSGRDFCLAMTHEEVVTFLARGELRSYRQLPQIWYQIQTKFRDEPRPKSGLLRVRQFIMKDSYTFDRDATGLDAAYQKALCCISQDIRAVRFGVRDCRSSFGRNGRQPVTRVHGSFGHGRRLCCELSCMRLRGKPGESQLSGRRRGACRS
jgi:prolyl-tRNA synthetase family II